MNYSNDIIIKEFLSPDERYIIFLDDLYDVEKKINLGNIWENFDNLKFFLRYSFHKSDLDITIKENAFKILNGSLIIESTEDILKFKNEIKQYISEGVWDNFKDWAKETGQSTVDGFKEFISKTKKGASEIVDKISNAQWSDVISLLGKGIHYFAKKLRDAMYHPVGLVIDAILVASGIGKTVQWIPWAIIVGLDIYELFSGDYDSLFEHLLSTFFDVLGLVFTGAVAKGLRLTLKGVKTSSDLNRVIASNPTIKKYFSKLPEILTKISPKLKSAINYLSTKFPKAANFLKGILGMVDKFINKITTDFSKLLKPSVAIAGGISGGITAGVGTYEKSQEKENENIQTVIDTMPDKDFTGKFF